MRLPGLLLAVAPSFLAFACGVQADQAPTPATYPDYLKLQNQLVCEARLRCCGSVCSDLMDSTFYKLLPRTLDYIDKGLIAYDPQAAATCLASLATRYASCDSEVYQLPALIGCDKILIPQNLIGGICEARPVSCTPDAFCSGGHCTAYAKAGQMCGAGAGQCIPGTYCNTAVAPFVCTPYAQKGESCMTKPCDPTASLFCLPGMVCGVAQPVGAACSAANQCMSGLCDAVVNLCLAPEVPLTLQQQLCAMSDPGMPTG
jgi:hypothetical protein